MFCFVFVLVCFVFALLCFVLPKEQVQSTGEFYLFLTIFFLVAKDHVNILGRLLNAPHVHWSHGWILKAI